MKSKNFNLIYFIIQLTFKMTNQKKKKEENAPLRKRSLNSFENFLSVVL